MKGGDSEMKEDALVIHSLQYPGAYADYPFGPDPLVIKVCGKIFALFATSGTSVSLKCEPLMAELLRAQYPSIRPGYHLNKRHWNTVSRDGSIPEGEMHEMIRQSYDLVRRKLTLAERRRLDEKQS